MDKSRIAVALVHHPVLNRLGETSTTAITSMDIHDFARTCAFYDVKPVFVVHPAEGMQNIIEVIVDYWRHGAGRDRNPGRGQSMAELKVVNTLSDAIETMGDCSLWYTSANPSAQTTMEVERLNVLSGRHLIVFGTGWGLDAKLLQTPTGWLSPIQGIGMVRHLSVRSALAIYLDRLRR